MTNMFVLVIVVLFFLEKLWGGSDYTPTLMHMGANASSKVYEGEVWRLLTSIFLHGGYLHVLFNLYVLVVLGKFVNRMIGTAPYVTLFLLSGLIGSLMSVYVGHVDVSIGASGAIWGLFGATAAWVLRPSTLLPDEMRIQMRRMMLLNIAINLAISFLPGIDLWAHVGGGLAGFLIGYLISLSPWNRIYEFSSRFLVACVFVSFVAAFYLGKPWQLTQDMKLESKFVPNTSFMIGVPTWLSYVEENQFGQLPFDPIEIVVDAVPANSVSEAQLLRSWMNRTGVRPVRVEDYYVFGDRYFVCWKLRDEQLVQIEIVVNDDTPQNILDGIPRIFDSLYGTADLV